MELKNFFAQDSAGNLIANPTATLYLAGTMTLATGLQDKNGAALTNPFTGTADGLVSLAAPNGDYDLNITGAGRTTTQRVRFIDAGMVESDIAAAMAIATAANSGVSDIASQTDDTKGAALVGYDDTTLLAVADEARPMANYTALRAYTGRAQAVRITQSGIAGFFRRNDADTTSADNGGTIIVDASGRRWFREFSLHTNVLWFGAKGDGATGTNDTAAIQAAATYCKTYGYTLYFPAAPGGYYNVTGTGPEFVGPLSIAGDGEASYIRNASGNACRVRGTALRMRGLKFTVPAGGHVIVQSGNVDQCRFENISLEQSAAGYSLWDNAGFMYIDIHWSGFRFQHVLTATVPGFNLVGAGGTLNDNTWEKGRATNSGNYFWNVETTTDNFQYSNTWRDITFEVCVGGGVRQVGAYNFLIENGQNWDAQVSGPVLKNFYSVEKHATYSRGGRGIIRNCGRWAGVNNTGIYDISTPSGGLGSGIIIESCYAAGTSTTTAFTADLKGNSCVVIGTTSGQFQALNDSATVYAGGGVFKSNYGYQFPATQPGTSDLYTLDRYVESDPAALPTPTVKGVTTAGAATYTTQKCSYTVEGNRVFFSLVVSWSGHTGTGSMRVVTGIPFTASASSVSGHACSVIPSNITFTGVVGGYVVSGTNEIAIGQAASGAGFALLNVPASGSLTITGQFDI